MTLRRDLNPMPAEVRQALEASEKIYFARVKY